MNRVGIIVEARMNSSRLPGKVLKKVINIPLLLFMIKRLKLIKNVDEIIIATTKSYKDDAICKLAKENNIKYFRGSEKNVMLRVIQAAKKFKIKHIVEITGDDPLVDPKISSYVIKKYLKNFKYNSICANDFYSQVPLGFYTRIFSLNTLKKIHKKSNKFNKEHVESYFYQNPNKFHFLHTHKSSKLKKNDIRLTLDTKKDLIIIKKIITNFRGKYDFSIHDIFNYLDKKPQLKKINNSIIQNEIR